MESGAVHRSDRNLTLIPASNRQGKTETRLVPGALRSESHPQAKGRGYPSLAIESNKEDRSGGARAGDECKAERRRRSISAAMAADRAERQSRRAERVGPAVPCVIPTLDADHPPERKARRSPCGVVYRDGAWFRDQPP